MNVGMRILFVLLGIGAVGAPLFVAPRGYGLETQTNSLVVLERKDCPPEKKDVNGNCPVSKNIRSRYARSFLGGGTSGGK